MKAIIEGVNYVIPRETLMLLTWEELESRACGDKIIDPEKLKKMTVYYVIFIFNDYFRMEMRVMSSFRDSGKCLRI